jgi:hypothetical protein
MSSEWEVPLDDVDPERIGGMPIVAPGEFHTQVNAWWDAEPKTGKTVADVEVLAGTTPGQEGKGQWIFFDDPNEPGLAQNARLARIGERLRFAVACGLVTKEEIKEAKEKKQRLALNMQLAVGRHLIIRVTKNDKTKTKTKVDGFWNLHDPEAPKCPMNLGMLEKQGDAAADPFGGEDPFS